MLSFPISLCYKRKGFREFRSLPFPVSTTRQCEMRDFSWACCAHLPPPSISLQSVPFKVQNGSCRSLVLYLKLLPTTPKKNNPESPVRHILPYTSLHFAPTATSCPGTPVSVRPCASCHPTRNAVPLYNLSTPHTLGLNSSVTFQRHLAWKTCHPFHSLSYYH